MKKGLSLLLAASLAFSAFTSAALAADPMTAEEKYNALVQANIFDGFPDGQAHLDQNMTRAQAAKVITLVLGLNENPAGSSIYTDLADAQWAAGFIGAATQAGILEGRGNGIFDPSADVTIQELAKIMVEALNIEVDADATVEGADDWAAAYVAAAVAAGLIAEQTDYTVPAPRSILVESSYAAYEQVKPVTAITAVATATSAKEITVTFNQAVDTEKASIGVTFNNNTVNPSKTTFADDAKSVVIAFANNLPAGDYTVTVSGLTEEALTSVVKFEAQKVSKIEFTSTTAVKDRDESDVVTVGYQVLDQYGKKMDITPTATASKGTATYQGSNVVIDADGIDFTIGEKVALSLIDSTSGVFASQTFDVVAAAHVATVGITELYQEDDKILEAGSTNEFFLVLDLKDQYGNAITSDKFASDLIVTVSNPAVASLEDFDGSTAKVQSKKIDNSDKLVIKLAPKDDESQFTAGTSVISVISKLSGSRATFDVNVKDTSKVDTLSISSPSLAPVGEKVEIPYTAVDQFGETVKHPVMTDKLSATGNATVYFEKDVVKDETKLILDLTAAGVSKGTIVITGLTDTNKFVQLSVSVVDAAVPTVISGVKDIATLLKGNSLTVGKNKVVVKDQYGRDIDITSDKFNADYGVKVAVSGSAVITDDETLPATFTADKKGTSSVTLSLTKEGDDVSNSSYTFSYKAVESGDISTYEATVTGTVYDDGSTDYAKALEVKGVLADGSKVVVPYDDGKNYRVVVPSGSNALKFDEDESKVYSDGSFFSEANKDGEGTVVVTILANNQVIPVTVAVSSDIPEITTLNVKGGGVAKLEGDNYISVKKSDLENAAELHKALQDAVEVKDQYGKTVAEVYPTVIVTGLASGEKIDGVNDAVGTNLTPGKAFNVMAFTANGKSVNVKIVVAED